MYLHFTRTRELIVRNLQVEKNDALPQYLCSACWQEIMRIKKFQKNCRQSLTLLRISLAEVEVVKHEIKDEVVVKQEEDCDLGERVKSIEFVIVFVYDKPKTKVFYIFKHLNLYK